MTNTHFLFPIFVATVTSLFATTWSEMSQGLAIAVPGIDGLILDPSSPSTIYARTFEGAIFKSTDGAGSWRPLNGLTSAGSLVIDPKNSSTLYAGTRRGVVKSTDDGESWIGASAGMTTTLVTRLAIDPINTSTLYAVCFQNVFKSADAGGSWKAVTGLPRQTFDIVIDPLTPSIIYATSDSGLFRSTDAGETWSAMAGSPAANAPVSAVAVSPTDSSTIYLGYLEGAARSAVVIKTTDGGKYWTTVQAGLPPRAAIRSILIDPRSPSTLYVVFHASAGVGFVKSTDAGASWNAIDEGLPAGTTLMRSLALDPSDSSTLYAAYYDVRTIGGGVLKSTSGGSSWSPADSGLRDIDIRVLALDPTNVSTVYSGGNDGLFRSLDGGTNWNHLITFQLPAPSWPPPLTQPPPFGGGAGHTRSLLIDFANPSVLYARTIRYNACAFSDKLLFKSSDGGATWSDSASPPSSGCTLSDLLVADPKNPNILYSSEFNDGSSLLKSTDGGGTWKSIWWRDTFVLALAIDHRNPAILYAGLGDTSESSVNGVVKSLDGGASWTTIGLAGSTVSLLVMDPSDPNILYAATEGNNSEPRGFRGLFKTTDGGASWSAINSGLENLIDTRRRIAALVIDRERPGYLYAGSAGAGVFRSTDAGVTWNPFNDGLTRHDIRALALAPGDSASLYAGTPGGVFKISAVVATF
jgi:photosystem II stability/assembly factor-like uncharacterized protein